jgi:hypothetical protein
MKLTERNLAVLWKGLLERKNTFCMMTHDIAGKLEDDILPLSPEPD